MNKNDVIDKETLEKYYTKRRKFKFKDETFKPKNVEEIFDKLVRRTYGNETVFMRGGLQCSTHKSRSIDDLVVLAKYYLPELSVKQILIDLKTVLNRQFEGDPYNYRNVGYCPNIRKNNFWPSLYSNNDNNIKRFENVSFYSNGFKNLNLKIKDIIE